MNNLFLNKTLTIGQFVELYNENKIIINDHANLWTTGSVDQVEYEKRMNKKINFKTTYSSQKSDQESQQKLLGNQTNPTNQHGARNSSKPSKKN